MWIRVRIHALVVDTIFSYYLFELKKENFYFPMNEMEFHWEGKENEKCFIPKMCRTTTLKQNIEILSNKKKTTK